MRRRGRTASTFYPDLITAFIAAGEPAMDVDVAKIGRKPNGAFRPEKSHPHDEGRQDKVRVSMLGDEVILIAL